MSAIECFTVRYGAMTGQCVITPVNAKTANYAINTCICAIIITLRYILIGWQFIACNVSANRNRVRKHNKVGLAHEHDI